MPEKTPALRRSQRRSTRYSTAPERYWPKRRRDRTSVSREQVRGSARARLFHGLSAPNYSSVAYRYYKYGPLRFRCCYHRASVRPEEPLPRPDDALNLHPAADGFTWSTQVSPSVTVTVNSFLQDPARRKQDSTATKPTDPPEVFRPPNRCRCTRRSTQSAEQQTGSPKRPQKAVKLEVIGKIIWLNELIG